MFSRINMFIKTCLLLAFLLTAVNLMADPGDDPPPGCECDDGYEYTCSVGDCDLTVCCKPVVIPIVDNRIIYLVFAGGLLMMFSIIRLKPGFYKSQYSALLKNSRKIRRFF